MNFTTIVTVVLALVLLIALGVYVANRLTGLTVRNSARDAFSLILLALIVPLGWALIIIRKLLGLLT